jgi:hypothetical protein
MNRLRTPQLVLQYVIGKILNTIDNKNISPMEYIDWLPNLLINKEYETFPVCKFALENEKVLPIFYPK